MASGRLDTDCARRCAARLAGVEAPKHEDNEATIEELCARVRQTVAFIESVAAANFEGSDSRDVTIPRRDGPMVLRGEVYLVHYALPNFYFHAGMTYALLRHNGVELGKGDYLGL